MANIKRVSESINSGKGTVGRLIQDDELAKKLDTTITKLSELTSELEAGQGTAGKLFKDETLFNNANQMITEASALVKAVKENPKKYLSIKLHIF